MEFIQPEISQYAEAHTSPESTLLRRINHDTYKSVHMPRMLSGHLQGRFLTMISKMIRPRTILEIGTYTGYSALCLAEGLATDGKLITIDVNEELEERVRNYFTESGREKLIDFRIGNANEIIPGLTGPFDLVWIDADKENYSHYFDLVIDKVSPGGYILADNVLWSGKVLDVKPDKDTRAIKGFNEKINTDERVENLLLPVRDGIMMIRKI
ncbi:MAG TPA: O-methyltransferase [Cyclobacteriaceae bacterium]|nr:O-methyltransferase [Cyclobacteriaceae bacterium]